MRRILTIFFLMILGVISFGEVYDEAKLLKEEEKGAIEVKLKELEDNFNVKFKIVVSDGETNIKQYSEKLSKGVIIHLERDKQEGKLRLKLLFTKDIDINTYKEEMQRILDDSQPLVDSGKFVDLIYELTGSIAEIINLVNADERAAFRKNMAVAAGVVIFFVIIGGISVVLIIKRAARNKKNLCRFCDIEMDLVDEYKEENKVIRLYNCHVCGHSKKISFRH